VLGKWRNKLWSLMNFMTFLASSEESGATQRTSSTLMARGWVALFPFKLITMISAFLRVRDLVGVYRLYDRLKQDVR